MYRGKFLILILICLIAKSASADVERASSSTRSAGTASKFGIGLAYFIFNERFQIDDGAQFERVYANYAGAGLLLDKSWTKGRQAYGVSGGFASGKATVDIQGLAFPEYGRRTWTLFYIEPSYYYRLNQSIMIGFGILAGNRTADWKSPSNPAIHTTSVTKAIYAPELLFRWNVSRRFTIVQSLSTPDFRGTTMWRWSSQFNL